MGGADPVPPLDPLQERGDDDQGDADESETARIAAGQGSYDLLTAPGKTPGQQRFRDTIRAVAASLEVEGAICADEAKWRAYLKTVPEERRFIEGSIRKLRFSLHQALKAARCPFCWVLREACFCDELPYIHTRLNFAVLYHPHEFCRATSTGKLVSQVLGGEFLLYGQHEARMRDLINDPNTYILFPDETAVTLEDIEQGIAQRGAALPEPPGGADAPTPTPTPPATALPDSVRGLSDITVLVLDGTWGQARVLFSIITKINPQVKRLRLNLQGAVLHESMFSSLRKQSEAGRVSTFEACMLLLEEAGHGTQSMSDVMKAMVTNVNFEKHRSSPFGEVTTKRAKLSMEGHRRRSEECTGIPRLERRGIKKTTDVELERWIELLQKAALQQPMPDPVVRRCSYCAMWLPPPRMLEHVKGRNHCQTVAKLHLGRPPGRDRLMPPPGANDRAKDVTQGMADAVYNDTTQDLLGTYRGALLAVDPPVPSDAALAPSS